METALVLQDYPGDRNPVNFLKLFKEMPLEEKRQISDFVFKETQLAEIQNIKDKQLEMSTDISELKHDMGTIKELAIKNSHVESRKTDLNYVNMTEIGKSYVPPIINNYSKILVWAGLARKDKNTVPTEYALRNEIAMAVNFKNNNNGYSGLSYKWHCQKTKDFIDGALRRAGILEQFYSQNKKNEIDKFINEKFI